jgi:CheY-like chemotaxis protein
LLDSAKFEDSRVDETLDKIKHICSQFVEISSMEIGNKDSINGSSFITLLKNNVQNVKLNKNMEEVFSGIKLSIDPLSMQNLFTAIASYFGSNEFQSNVFAEILKVSDKEFCLKLVRRNVSVKDSAFYETKTLKPGYVSYSVVERLCEIKSVGLKHLADKSEEVLLLNFPATNFKKSRKDEVSNSLANDLTPSKRFDPSTQKLLLMEDNDVLRDVIGENLKRAGYQVLTAADGEIGVSLFEENIDEIGFVISDVVMPKLNGVNAVNKLLKKRPELPVVFLTGTHLDRGDLDYCDETDYQVIHKPVKTKQLIEIIKTYEKE